mmetsp:Transcript_3299/g.7427  ORF Transcript_3299/g.7427 Transcript_3299/m.7427 type:complete len:215 (-) Transcript_3299:999-1643(-)
MSARPTAILVSSSASRSWKSPGRTLAWRSASQRCCLGYRPLPPSTPARHWKRSPAAPRILKPAPAARRRTLALLIRSLWGTLRPWCRTSPARSPAPKVTMKRSFQVGSPSSLWPPPTQASSGNRGRTVQVPPASAGRRRAAWSPTSRARTEWRPPKRRGLSPRSANRPLRTQILCRRPLLPLFMMIHTRWSICRSWCRPLLAGRSSGMPLRARP